jgi:hypothetical protein
MFCQGNYNGDSYRVSMEILHSLRGGAHGGRPRRAGSGRRSPWVRALTSRLAPVTWKQPRARKKALAYQTSSPDRPAAMRRHRCGGTQPRGTLRPQGSAPLPRLYGSGQAGGGRPLARLALSHDHLPRPDHRRRPQAPPLTSRPHRPDPRPARLEVSHRPPACWSLVGRPRGRKPWGRHGAWPLSELRAAGNPPWPPFFKGGLGGFHQLDRLRSSCGTSDAGVFRVISHGGRNPLCAGGSLRFGRDDTKTVHPFHRFGGTQGRGGCFHILMERLILCPFFFSGQGDVQYWIRRRS